jgi:hypothetical protein
MSDRKDLEAAEALTAEMLGRVADEEMAGLSIDDLADAMSHPLAKEVVAELLPLEAASVQQGERAPDFSLPWLPGQGKAEGESFTLSSRAGQRPVALIFGSYT